MITACTNGPSGRRCAVCIAWDAAMAAARLVAGTWSPAPPPRPRSRDPKAIAQRLLRERRKRDGVCLTCGDPAGVGIYCEPCAADARFAAKVRYERRVAEKVCIWCRLPATNGVYCAAHYAKRHAAKLERRA